MTGSELVDVGLDIGHAERIAFLNDQLRKSGCGGRLVVTQGVLGLSGFDARLLCQALAAYDRFDDRNDPYGERDFGDLQVFGRRLLWKIDYYDRELQYGSPDPSDPDVTTRVLTVMLESEY